MILYHFTCNHAAAAIEAARVLRPSPVTGLLWLTDLEAAPREVLGLTSHSLDCDRMDCRFEVSVENCPPIYHWPNVRRIFGPVARALESTPGAMPMHWWISTAPIRLQRATAAGSSWG